MSPSAQYLPAGPTQCARFLFVRAKPGSQTYPPTRFIMLQHAATGIEDYTDRQDQVGLRLLEKGIATAIFIPPFNGARRPIGQDTHHIDNVSDYMIQSSAVITEGVALIRHFHNGFAVREGENVKVPVGVTGASWGGAMAACTALVSRRPVVCVPCLASDSPKVMSSGIINWQLDWETLQREKGHTREEAQVCIESIFTRTTFATLLENAPEPKRNIQSLVCVSGKSDHFVSADEVTLTLTLIS